MRTIPINLLNDFKSGFRSTIIKITAKDSTVYAYTDHDFSLTVDGVTYVPAPGLQRINLSSSTGDAVSNQEFGSAWVDAPEEDLIAGKLDNATIEVAFCSWKNPAYGKTVIDKGTLGIIQWTADGFRADMHSHMRTLQRNISFPVTSNCRHQLFSNFSNDKLGACTLNKASYTYTGSVKAVLTSKLKFTTNGLSQPDGWCTNGIITWTSGANAGLSSEVKAHTVGLETTIELFLPSFTTISVNDNFSITAGCDKTHATCKSKFNNIVNFGGFEFIQTEIQYR